MWMSITESLTHWLTDEVTAFVCRALEMQETPSKFKLSSASLNKTWAHSNDQLTNGTGRFEQVKTVESSGPVYSVRKRRRRQWRSGGHRRESSGRSRILVSGGTYVVLEEGDLTTQLSPRAGKSVLRAAHGQSAQSTGGRFSPHMTTTQVFHSPHSFITVFTMGPIGLHLLFLLLYLSSGVMGCSGLVRWGWMSSNHSPSSHTPPPLYPW